MLDPSRDHQASVDAYQPMDQKTSVVAPIIQQPQGVSQGNAKGIENIEGLENLADMRHLVIEQQIEQLEILTGFETKNKYKVKDSIGNDLYFAEEEPEGSCSNCCTRNCCGAVRPFDMEVKDQRGGVIHFSRPLRCTHHCWCCCRQKLVVSCPPGTIIGTVQQKWSIYKPYFHIYDQDGNLALKVSGPCCTSACCCGCCGSVEFAVTSPKGEQVGIISKDWSGLLTEAFTDADVYGITFPKDLDLRIKATLMGAAILIDFMYFEQSEEGVLRKAMRN